MAVAKAHQLAVVPDMHQPPPKGSTTTTRTTTRTASTIGRRHHRCPFAPRWATNPRPHFDHMDHTSSPNMGTTTLSHMGISFIPRPGVTLSIPTDGFTPLRPTGSISSRPMVSHSFLRRLQWRFTPAIAAVTTWCPQAATYNSIWAREGWDLFLVIWGREERR